MSESGLARRVAALQGELAERDPSVLAANTGSVYAYGRFLLDVWGTAVALTFPEFEAEWVAEGTAVDPLTAAILAYHFHTADGTPLAGRWVAFSALPDGQFYTIAFQGYTGQVLLREFGDRVERFAETAVGLGGEIVDFADAAFRFSVLPRLAVLVAVWQGDEDFPPSYRILFDAHTSHHLPTDGCAIIGSILTRKLLQA